MKQLENLIDRVATRANMNLREFDFDVTPYIKNVIPSEKFLKFYAFYGVTSHHPLYFNFVNSNLAGSYFLGKCTTDHSILYKTDVRGDELKKKGDSFNYQGLKMPIENDEVIIIKDSFLIKTLIHNCSHDPESPEEFLIRNTVSNYYSNIHGAPVEGCYLASFSTVDLTSLHSCIIGAFSYVQAPDLYYMPIKPGTIWIKGDDYKFKYTYDSEILDKYIQEIPGEVPRGIFMDFMESRKDDFSKIFDSAVDLTAFDVPEQSAVSRYAYITGDTHISENVLISQRAYLENAWMGPGSNAQENSYIINSRLEKNDITAHGAKIINAKLGEKVFVAFNSFLHGTSDCPLTIGAGCMVMPHTIMDLEEPLTIPEGTVAWGYIRNQNDLEENSVLISDLKKVNGKVNMGNMEFKGNGEALISAFEHRIDHILEANGAYFSGDIKLQGHAQEGRSISYNLIQPYLTGKNTGIYPSIDIRP